MGVMPPTIRSTEPTDQAAVLSLVRAAFATGGRDGQEEVDIVVKTWQLGGEARAIDLVAVDDGVIVGHVLGARGLLGGVDVLGVAPLAVAPSRQQAGVGTALMHELLRRADEAGWPAAAVLGDPGYYSRFGFESSAPLGISYPPVGESPYFQIRRLTNDDEQLRGQFGYCWEIS